jgi:hypothetical protein
LDDIRNSEKIKYVMINGKLYEAETMNEYGAEKIRPRLWWQTARGESFGFTADTETQTFTTPECD